MISRECQFMVGHVGIYDQFAIMRDIARMIRAQLGPGPIQWDVLQLTRTGVVRMVGYRPDPPPTTDHEAN
jgi:hypothetical protein